MTSLTTAGSPLLQELAAGRSSSPHATSDALAALARINDRTRSALAGKQRIPGPDKQGE